MTLASVYLGKGTYMYSRIEGGISTLVDTQLPGFDAAPRRRPRKSYTALEALDTTDLLLSCLMYL
jgi:hypothetical protein